ncbi:hypothetical protein BDA96_10G177200 [Sorghum bicolor]|uniref:Uncharacterized protein n=1 Tax=Sorghum bicolor TaxID=4558 RepID=A0A921Q523_SORBI|nr:hypothetical protein BDA96_10G177200 [Sorghum bicolor]
MKKHIFGKFKKAKGESSSQGSHHAHGREEEEGYHGMVPYEPPSRMRELESGLMLSQEELQRYYIIREGLFLHTSIIDPDLLARTSMDVELDKVFRAIGTRRVTRRMMQAAQMEQGGSSHHDVEEGDEAMSVDASDSMDWARSNIATGVTKRPTYPTCARGRRTTLGWMVPKFPATTVSEDLAWGRSSPPLR